MLQAQVGGDGAESGNRISGLHGELFVIAHDKVFKDGISLIEGSSTCQAQLKNEPFLEGLEGTFDAAFSLRGTGGDMLNP